MKAYTDLEQSKKLAEILPLESADMHYFIVDSLEKQEINYAVRCGTPIVKTDIPCWSLTALLGILPFVDLTMPQLIGTPKTLYRCMYNDNLKSHTHDNPIDACVEMIGKLHELKLL